TNESSTPPRLNKNAVAIAPMTASPHDTLASDTVLYTSVNIVVVSATATMKLRACNASSGSGSEEWKCAPTAAMSVDATTPNTIPTPALKTIAKAWRRAENMSRIAARTLVSVAQEPTLHTMLSEFRSSLTTADAPRKRLTTPATVARRPLVGLAAC